MSIQPRQRSFYHPAMATEFLARLDPSPCNPRSDAPIPQCLSATWIVVPFVGVQLGRSLSWPSSRPPNWLNGINGCFQHLGVVNIGCRLGYGERDSFSVDHKVALRARFAAIRRIRSGFSAPPGAGTLAESSEARDQSIWSVSPSRSNNAWWIFFQIPASCQSRRRRQQVMPLPHPISWGNNSQGIPVRNTKRIPVSTFRSEMRGRPPFGFGGSGGSSGAITFHSSSGSNGLAICPLYTKTRFC